MSVNTQNKIDALYVRVSTAHQKIKESPETQRVRLLEYANNHELNPAVYIDDGFSAKDTNRPAFKRLLADIKAGKVRSVIVTKLDRLSRNLQDAIALIYKVFDEYKISLHALDQHLDSSNPIGRLMINLLVTVGQWEREMTSERVKTDMYHQARKGKWCGGPVPYGYASHSALLKHYINSGLSKEKAFSRASAICPEEKLLYPHAEHALIVKEKIFEKYLSTKSLRAVTHSLNNEGIKTARGTTWATSSISRVLKNPVYIGKMIYGKRELSKNNKMTNRPEADWIKADGVHSSLIDIETFKRTQGILKLQSTEPVRHTSEYLLSSLLLCGKCGGKMHGYQNKKWSYYRCTNHTHKGNTVCTGNSIDREKIEKAVIDSLFQIRNGEVLIELERAISVFNKKFGKHDNSLKGEKEKLEKENRSLLRDKKVLITKLSKGTISDSDFQNFIKEMDVTIERNTRRIEIIGDMLSDKMIREINFETVYENLNNLPKRWETADSNIRKALLLGLIKTIKYFDVNTNVDIEIYCLKKRTAINSQNLSANGHGFMAAINRNCAG